MGVDEEGTLAALKAYRRELIDPKIAEHRGRIVKTTGDGALVEFRKRCRRSALRDGDSARHDGAERRKFPKSGGSSFALVSTSVTSSSTKAIFTATGSI